MICDDNDRLRRLLVQMLIRQEDLELVGETGSAEDLLELLGGEPPDVILLDVNLPGLNGLEGIASLRGAGYTNPVVVMSADRHNERPARRAGAAAFFYKGSTDIAELFAMVRRAVTRPHD